MVKIKPDSPLEHTGRFSDPADGDFEFYRDPYQGFLYMLEAKNQNWYGVCGGPLLGGGINWKILDFNPAQLKSLNMQPPAHYYLIPAYLYIDFNKRGLDAYEAIADLNFQRPEYQESKPPSCQNTTYEIESEPRSALDDEQFARLEKSLRKRIFYSAKYREWPRCRYCKEDLMIKRNIRFESGHKQDMQAILVCKDY